MADFAASTMDFTKVDFTKLQAKLSKELDEERYQHTLGVMFTSASLAMAHGADVQKAQLAGLLHDCAKCIPNKRKIKLCEDNHIPFSKFEREHPFLLHARLGAFIAESKYGVSDSDILSAIVWHTTGRPDMTLLEKIVYIADYIEPQRAKAPNLTAIRRLAFKDLDECVYRILKDSVEYLEQNPKDLDTTTVEAFEYYKKLHEKTEEMNS